MKRAPQRMSSIESKLPNSQGDYSTKEILAHYNHLFKSLQVFLK
jgi:hypothetical protein